MENKQMIRHPIKKAFGEDQLRGRVFVIGVMTDEDKTPRYHAIDSSSGGCSYWADKIITAKHFDTKEEAQEILTRELGTKRSVYSDGSTAPNSFVSSALRLKNTKRSGTGYFFVGEFRMMSVWFECLRHDKKTDRHEQSKFDWRDLHYIQSKYNNNTGLEPVRVLCEYLKKEDFEKASSLILNSREYLQDYPDIIQWLEEAGFSLTA